MPFNRLALILALVILAAGVTVGLGALLTEGAIGSSILLLLIPASLVASLVVRLITGRSRKPDAGR